MEYLVSIIIPVYKVEEYLNKCVESIVGQTYSNLEIILVDDGSPDLCPKKCDEWAKKDARIKVVHKVNGGVGYARNSGIEISTGDYIMFVDSDDYLPCDAIEKMLKRIVCDNSDMVIGKLHKVYPNGDQIPQQHYSTVDLVINKEEAFRMLGSLERPFSIYAWGKLYKKSIFDHVRFTRLTTAEDVYAMPSIIDRCEKISILSDVVYYYFQRDTSIVHTVTKEKHIDNIKVCVYVARFLLDRNFIKEARLYYNSAICQYLVIRSKEAKKIITDSFDRKERQQLRKSKGAKMWLSIMTYRFPRLYKFYKSFKK